MSITMYDSINVPNIPAHAQADAGYVDGAWPTFSHLSPAQYQLSIAVFASDNADCLDVESGDAVNSQAPGWWVRAKGNHYLYTSASNSQALINTMAGAGVLRSRYKLWSAHYTGYAHICAPNVCCYPQADATQWTSNGPGGNLDVSLCADDFFVTSPPPPPAPTAPPMEDDVQILPKSGPVGVSFDGTPYKTIGFVADPGVIGGGTVTVRCAFHLVNGGWSVQEVSLNPDVTKAVVSVPANCDGVSFTREDTMPIILVPNFA